MKFRSLLLLTVIVGLCLIGDCEFKCTNHTWDYLLFSQQWPQTECEAASQHKCVVNKNITAWTVHGIWPTKYGEECPNYCNNSDKFQPQQISSIEAELREIWPNLFTDEEYYEFWEHEWQKHGTCGKTLEALNSQYKYFDMGLMLHKKFDLSSILAQKNIKPGNTYKLTDIDTAVQNLGPPKIRCNYIDGKEYLAQISLCLGKEFQMLNCSNLPKFTSDNSLYGVEPCSERHMDTVYYPTIVHN